MGTIEALCTCLQCRGIVLRTIRDSKKPEGLVLWGRSGSERDLVGRAGAMATGQKFGRGYGRPHDCRRPFF
jgi:hypothetical protein